VETYQPQQKVNLAVLHSPHGFQQGGEMLTVLIVDDDKDVRATLRELIELELPDGSDIKIEAEPPLPEVNDYSSYVLEHEIAVLILDERLNERPLPSTGKHVGYLGHDVIAGIRSSLPDFPVFVVTTYAGDDALNSQSAEFEAIVDRDEFRNKSAEYTKRILRAGSRFHESMQQQLALISELSLKALNEPLSEEDKKRLNATRQLLGFPFAMADDALMSDLVNKAQQLALESKTLLASLSSKG
jgi:CheY-like chemotaxis protein